MEIRQMATLRTATRVNVSEVKKNSKYHNKNYLNN